MSFKVTYELRPSRNFGGIPTYACIIKCTNLLLGETVDIALIPSNGDQPWVFRNVKFNATQSREFSEATVNWTWCQNDSIAIIDSHGHIKQQWPFRLKEYRPGECPDCHGTHKCKYCRGQGFRIPKNLEDMLRPKPGQILGGECEKCWGTGTCQKCYIPTRSPRLAPSSWGTPPSAAGGPAPSSMSRADVQRKIATISQEISNLEHKIQNLENDIRIWQIQGMDLSCKLAYQAKLDEKHAYSMSLISLQSELQRLQNMLI